MIRHLYFGYGMNTNISEMSQRCPMATSLGSAQLLDHEFRFAGHADVVPQPGQCVDGVLWSITDQCLSRLDALEGYPYYYNRLTMPVLHDDQTKLAIVYFMNPGVPDSLPSRSYFDMVLEGYEQHQVPVDQLLSALECCPVLTENA